MGELQIRDIAGIFFLIVGVFFSTMGTIGLYRIRDLYVRIHSSGLISILGIYSFILATFCLNSGMTLKILVLALFVFLMQPVASQVIAQAAYQAGKEPSNVSIDELKGKIEMHKDQLHDLDD
jgi:multicomponent Na+:H+ antiporter subunit G